MADTEHLGDDAVGAIRGLSELVGDDLPLLRLAELATG
jgi:hypothetical protein